MIKYLLPFLLLIPSPVFAQVSATSTSTPGASSASAGALGLGVVNESNTSNLSQLGGTINNVGNNVGSTFNVPSYAGIRDLRCEAATVEGSVFGTQAHSFSSGVVVSLRMPISNQAHRNCLELSSLYRQQTELDLYINVSKFCVEAASLGIDLTGAPDYIKQVCNITGDQ